MRPASESVSSLASPAVNAVSFLRGGHVESTHGVLGVVVREDGTVLAGSEPGAAEWPLFLRSLAKPFQALVAVEAGVLERFGLEERHLAAACGIHHATEDFVRCVRELLAASGSDVAELGCGCPAHGDPGLGALAHACAANHALMLALCRQKGWSTEDYLSPEHPAQRTVDAWLREHAGVPFTTAIDGCGMPAYRMPLAGLGRLYARLVGGGLGEAGRRVAEAMRRHPALVGGEGALDSALMEAEPGVVAKWGAEGSLVVATEDGRALVLKVRDGADRALEPAAVRAVRTGLGLAARSEVLERLASPAVTRLRDGAPVGSCEVSLEWRVGPGN